MVFVIKKTLTAVSLTFFALIYVGDSRSLYVKGQTRERDPFSNWRPSNDPQGIRYVGSAACAQCHAVEARPIQTLLWPMRYKRPPIAAS